MCELESDFVDTKNLMKLSNNMIQHVIFSPVRSWIPDSEIYYCSSNVALLLTVYGVLSSTTTCSSGPGSKNSIHKDMPPQYILCTVKCEGRGMIRIYFSFSLFLVLFSLSFSCLLTLSLSHSLSLYHTHNLSISKTISIQLVIQL